MISSSTFEARRLIDDDPMPAQDADADAARSLATREPHHIAAPRRDRSTRRSVRGCRPGRASNAGADSRSTSAAPTIRSRTIGISRIIGRAADLVARSEGTRPPCVSERRRPGLLIASVPPPRHAARSVRTDGELRGCLGKPLPCPRGPLRENPGTWPGSRVGG